MYTHSTGGDLSLPYVTTLPNILRQYSPDLYGFSTGITPVAGFTDLPNTRFNVARSGAQTPEMLQQAQLLVRKMYERNATSFESDWKLVTMYIGANDICKVSCNASDVDYMVGNITAALDYLRINLPRTFVNLVQLIDIGAAARSFASTPLGETCQAFFRGVACPCLDFGDNGGQLFETKVSQYQQRLRDLVGSGRYESESFTVVLQPFQEQFELQVVDGVANIDFSAPDCTHLSPAGNRDVATALWNNMLERVGEKTSIIRPSAVEMICPTNEQPFLFTALNSSKIIV